MPLLPPTRFTQGVQARFRTGPLSFFALHRFPISPAYGTFLPFLMAGRVTFGVYGMITMVSTKQRLLLTPRDAHAR